MPNNEGIDNGSLSAKLSSSKTISLTEISLCRLIVVESHVQEPSWLVPGWNLLSKVAPYERDCLLPMPANNFKGCKSVELRYDTAVTVQSRSARVPRVSCTSLDSSQREELCPKCGSSSRTVEFRRICSVDGALP